MNLFHSNATISRLMKSDFGPITVTLCHFKCESPKKKTHTMGIVNDVDKRPSAKMNERKKRKQSTAMRKGIIESFRNRPATYTPKRLYRMDTTLGDQRNDTHIHKRWEGEPIFVGIEFAKKKKQRERESETESYTQYTPSSYFPFGVAPLRLYPIELCPFMSAVFVLLLLLLLLVLFFFFCLGSTQFCDRHTHNQNIKNQSIDIFILLLPFQLVCIWFHLIWDQNLFKQNHNKTISHFIWWLWWYKGKTTRCYELLFNWVQV